MPAGSHALLVDLPDLAAARALHGLLTRARDEGRLTGVVDLVPAARTLLVVTDGPQHVGAARAVLDAVSPAELRPSPERVAGAEGSAGSAEAAEPAVETVTIPVVYDGADLQETAAALGIETDELVRRHTSEEWTVAFAGFAPGFGYCVGSEFVWDTPRRSEPRTTVPAGSVALAGEYTAVYPQDSPGGWQLIGRTAMPLFDPQADPPAPMRAGVRIRFEEVGR